MGKKDKKKKKGDGMEKTLAKTAKNELKALKKELGEDDIDELLNEIKKKDSQQTAIAITACDPPTPRSNASWLAHPTKQELLLFGGELYNGQTTSVYNDLFIYNIQKKEWKKVTSANCPPPRSAHQAVIIDKPESPQMWIFGGEFTSPSGNQFHHYRDLWVLDLNTYTWELKAGGEKVSKKSSSSASASSGPSPRSGHRMIVYKHKLIVFGGFFDSGYETKYFNDMYVYDLETMAWQPQVNFNSALAPGPRSGFGFFVNEQSDTAFLYGGFAMETKKKEAPKQADTKGKKVKASSQAQQVPVTYSDFWSLNLVNMSWTQVKKRGYFPAAGRFAMGVTTQKEKGRVFVFGGVKDQAKDGGKAKGKRDDDDEDEDTTSTNYNDLYCFDMHKEQMRWFFVDYKGDKADKSSAYEVSVKVKAKPKEGASEKKEDQDDEEGEEGESSIFDFNPVVEALPQISAAPSASSTSSMSLAPTPAVPIPSPRRSSLLCVKGSMCYLYSGVMEKPNSDVEHTFGDLWSIDVNKGNSSWELLMKPAETAEWEGSEGEGDEEEEEEEEEEKKGGKKKKKRDDSDDEDEDDDEDDDDDDSSSDEEEEEKSSSSSSSKTGINLKPSVGESLTVYFTRTKAHWMTAAVPALDEDNKKAAAEAEAAEKQAKLEAKERAEEEARIKAELEASGEAPAAAAAAPQQIDPEAVMPVDEPSVSDKDKEKEKKKKSKDKEKEKEKAEKESKKASKKAEKEREKEDPAALYEKQLRAKAFELAAARFQQR